MTFTNGYMGKWLKCDLTTGTLEDFEIPEELLRKYLGGKGIMTHMLYEHALKLEANGINLKEFDAFDAENPLLFATGPATGTRSPSSGRHHAMALKSPLTGSIGSGNTGGIWGAKLKFTGYDGIAFYGKSEKPVFLSIIDGKAELHDASKIWGLNSVEVTEKLKKKFDRSRAGVSCIGPAGENMVPIAVIMNEAHRAVGRTGMGAIMGSKKLKAMIVDGNAKPQAADPETFDAKVTEHRTKVKENGVTGEGLPAYGTGILVNIINENGLFPTNNWQEGFNPNAESISGETLAEEYLISKHACWGCPIACGRKSYATKGTYQIDKTEGPEFESMWALGNTTGINDMSAIIRSNHYADIFGMDPITLGSTIACAMELNEKGYIPKEDLQGIDLKFGNADAVVELTWMTAFKQGFGKTIGNGSLKLATKYGHPELSMSVKGLEMPAYDPRGAKGIGLNYATSNRGGCHVTGYTIAVEILGDVDRLSYEGKAELTKIFQDLTCVVNSTVNCLFLTFALGADEYAEILAPITGWDLTGDELMTIGDRIYTLERLIINKLGFAGEQDTLPKRILEEPLPGGASEGEIHNLEAIKKEYYDLRGWVDGVPTAEKLQELGL
ncbi:MAG: aldehyde ferredoxin oxidoreductase family protein [Candidatus Heimdallarchaeota archaeon]|nr:aldehyde ferredoxin oxidoreductase family protein [Candidatus Heimdallarchaeota archaeon]MCK5048519.1 aldehyde ferredoxin oxidoreductase family protein [Candidatus Heimdallarchaeota archaeon]